MAIKFESFSERGGWWVVTQFALFGLILLAMTRNQDAATVWQATVWQATGWLLAGAGALLTGAGLWVIRDTLTAMPAPLDKAVLRQHGPYTIVRHPIYSGLILGFAGLAVKGGNLVAIGLALGLIPFFYAKTSVEERLLVARFPEYAEYRRTVRYRVLPWIL
jgi:protein-S-isoprenylcysteine O-methyltransferase Ste14